MSETGPVAYDSNIKCNGNIGKTMPETTNVPLLEVQKFHSAVQCREHHEHFQERKSVMFMKPC